MLLSQHYKPTHCRNNDKKKDINAFASNQTRFGSNDDVDSECDCHEVTHSADHCAWPNIDAIHNLYIISNTNLNVIVVKESLS